jgi:serine protease Do
MHNTSRKSKFRRPRYNAVAAVAAWSLALSVPAFAAAPRTCDVAGVVARVLPSVVNISVAKVLRADGPNGKATGPEHLEFFVGSGVIVEPSGVIITNQHVIQDAARINVTFHDRTLVPARLITAAGLVDFALLKVDVGKPLPVLQFGDSDSLEVGQTVIAVGNPLGLGTSVSAGVVSAKDRNLMRGPFDDYVQTDASINPGNSGGPLLDCSGDIVGIDTALYSNSKVLGSIGLGFALPSDFASMLTYKFLHPSDDNPSWVGLQLQDVTPSIAKVFGLREVGGAIVTAVTPGSPAAHASLATGDIITSVDGQQLPESRAIFTRIVVEPPGDPIALSVWRDRRTVQVMLQGVPWPNLAELRSHILASAAAIARAEAAGTGLHLAAITDADRKRYDLGDASGVLIASVTEGSLAESLGLKPGEVIEKVDGVAATTPDIVVDRLLHPNAEDDDVVAVLVRGKSSTRWVTLYVGQIDAAALIAAPPPYPTDAAARNAEAHQP